MFYLFSNSGKNSGRFRRGLTLVEMLIVIAIFTVLTGIVLGNLPVFRDRQTIDLLAEEIALLIRQAQAYGIATRAFGASQSFPSNGIFINIDQSAGGDNKRLVLFADKNSDKKYNAGEESRETFELKGGAEISEMQLCTVGHGGAQEACPTPQIEKILAILFERPSPEAMFFNDYGNNLTSGFSYLKLKLSLKDEQGIEKASRGIIVWITGHIYTCKDYSEKNVCG